MFSSGGYMAKNGEQSLSGSKYTISDSVEHGGYINGSANNKRMEAKLIILILNIIGISSYFGAIWLNIGSWKADVLWFLAVLFGVVKFIRYTLKTWQDFRKTELDLKAQKKKIK